jgi:hypothetical protein
MIRWGYVIERVAAVVVIAVLTVMLLGVTGSGICRVTGG